ncbi:MAG: SDR family oxidoreductase [Gammaproteobacteria bacterium]
MTRFSGKVVLITGAAGGIGSALVKRFLSEDATVIANDIDADRLQALADANQSSFGTSHLILLPLDITDHAGVAASIERIWQQHPIDALVNNAGWDTPVQFIDSDPDVWAKLIKINLNGPLNLQHAIVPRMVERGSGKIVNIASDAGRVGSSGEAVYSACKGGIIAFSKSLAREVARANVQVNVVCPGPTDTALLKDFAGEGEYGQKIYDGLKRAIPMKRLGQPQDITGAVAFLASADADFVTGQTLSVSGGLTMHG